MAASLSKRNQAGHWWKLIGFLQYPCSWEATARSELSSPEANESFQTLECVKGAWWMWLSHLSANWYLQSWAPKLLQRWRQGPYPWCLHFTRMTSMSLRYPSKTERGLRAVKFSKVNTPGKESLGTYVSCWWLCTFSGKHFKGLCCFPLSGDKVWSIWRFCLCLFKPISVGGR